MNAVSLDETPPTSSRPPRSVSGIDGRRVLAGRWVLGDMLGEGGAATVYEARSRQEPQRKAAVKLLHSAVAGDASSRTRFVREAYIANQIDHPGVVRVLEDGEDEWGTPFLVMELLRGETLETRARRKGGKLPVEEVLWIADRLLDILGAAHARGIVHRDIKPENLFLTRDRELKVLDFGIARLAEGSHAATMAGTILGTLAYMPPEQARGSVTEIGAESDLWSVGATLFKLLSGTYVRDDGDVATLLYEAGNVGVRSLAEVAPELPREVTDLVDFALSHERSVRWPSAVMMRRAVRAAHARLTFHSLVPGGGNDDWEVSEPSFGFIAQHTSIAPPPVSLAPKLLESPRHLGNAETIPAPPLLIPAPPAMPKRLDPPKGRARAVLIAAALTALGVASALGWILAR